MKRLTLFSSVWMWLSPAGVTYAEQPKLQNATHPAHYTTIFELERRGKENILSGPYSDIDDRSMIAIRFDETKMALPSTNGYRVTIRVEAFQTKGGDRDRIAHIDYYVSQKISETNGGSYDRFQIHRQTLRRTDRTLPTCSRYDTRPGQI